MRSIRLTADRNAAAPIYPHKFPGNYKMTSDSACPTQAEWIKSSSLFQSTPSTVPTSGGQPRVWM